MERKIPIILAADSNFLPFVYVTIHSILQNRKGDYQLEFYILIPSNTKKMDCNAKWEFEGYEIIYVEVAEDVFPDVYTTKYLTKVTYYRLLIPNLFPQYEKCIYLDADIYACDDICELYDIDVSDVYLSAGLGTDIWFTEEYERGLADYLQIPSAKLYFNAGVLVMNLDKLRIDDMEAKFLECSKKKWECQDQDILNICCYGKVKIFNLRYNLYSFSFGYQEQQALMQTRFFLTEIKESLEKPCLVHFVAPYTKPWNNLNAILTQLWWQEAKKALPEYLYNTLYRAAEERTDCYAVSDIMPKMAMYEKIVIFGCGKVGKSLFKFLARLQPGKVIEFWDNNPVDQGKSFQGISVQAPKAKDGDDKLIIISCQNGQEEVRKQLYQMGYQEEELSMYKPGDIDLWFGTDFLYRIEITEKLRQRGCYHKSDGEF